MFTKKALEQSNSFADQAIKSTQRVASEALDSLADAMQDMRHQAAPLLNRATEQASALRRHGMDAIHDSSRQLHNKAARASASTVNYVKDEPVKALLIAAAAGAALMALVGLMSRSRDRD
jgi:ElaB/YqjD/DUF883 family membrane-anchored ribosome-binding protein